MRLRSGAAAPPCTRDAEQGRRRFRRAAEGARAVEHHPTNTETRRAPDLVTRRALSTRARTMRSPHRHAQSKAHHAPQTADKALLLYKYIRCSTSPARITGSADPRHCASCPAAAGPPPQPAWQSAQQPGPRLRAAACRRAAAAPGVAGTRSLAGWRLLHAAPASGAEDCCSKRRRREAATLCRPRQRARREAEVGSTASAPSEPAQPRPAEESWVPRVAERPCWWAWRRRWHECRAPTRTRRGRAASRRCSATHGRRPAVTVLAAAAAAAVAAQPSGSSLSALASRRPHARAPRAADPPRPPLPTRASHPRRGCRVAAASTPR